MLTFVRTVGDYEITYMMGKNQGENHPLIKNSEANDLWFHLHDRPSAHLVAQIASLTLSEDEVTEMITYGIEILKERMKIIEPTTIVMSHIKDLICLRTAGSIGYVKDSTQYLRTL
jgi:hypothetical protein